MDQFIALMMTRAAIGAASSFVPAAAPLDLTPTGSILEQSVPVAESRVRALAPAGRTIPHRRPLASLPGEDVASMREHGYTNGLRQDIMLRNDARGGVKNSITVLVRTSRQQSLDEQVPLYKPTEAGIRSEIGGQFPRLSMQVVERESSNSYGPYGLAIGRADKDVRCAYMWQWIDENRLPAETSMSGPVSLRIRLCKAGTTFDSMAAAFDRLTLGGTADMVASAGPIHTVDAPSEAEAPHRLHRKPSRRLAAHKRRSVVARQETVAPPSAATGPRYMSPSPLGAPTPALAMAPAPVAPQLSGDLPAQAYLGPTAKPSTTKLY